MLKDARSIAVDPIHNVIAVASRNGMLIFDRLANGNVKPRNVIKGPGNNNFRLLASKGYIIAGAGGAEDGGGGGRGGEGRGNAEAQPGQPQGRAALRVWSINDDGRVPPLFEIRSPVAAGPVGGGRVALDPKQKEVIVGGGQSVSVFSFPEIFN
jgi:hypothetical protein